MCFHHTTTSPSLTAMVSLSNLVKESRQLTKNMLMQVGFLSYHGCTDLPHGRRQQACCLHDGHVATVKAAVRGLLGKRAAESRITIFPACGIFSDYVCRAPGEASAKWFSQRLKLVHVPQVGCSSLKQRVFMGFFSLFCSVFLWDEGAERMLM